MSEKQRQWNKMWELWTAEQMDSPYKELMTYQCEINNGGHDQYFLNVGSTGDLQKEMSVLETALPTKLKENLQKAYKAYLAPEGNENGEEIIEQCDNVFYANEEDIIRILKEYAEKIARQDETAKREDE